MLRPGGDEAILRHEIAATCLFDFAPLREQVSQRHEETMEIGETLYVTTHVDFRKWLTKNHKSKKEIWLIQYKKVTKKPSINYVEAVEEAICFGWIVTKPISPPVVLARVHTHLERSANARRLQALSEKL